MTDEEIAEFIKAAENPTEVFVETGVRSDGEDGWIQVERDVVVGPWRDVPKADRDG